MGNSVQSRNNFSFGQVPQVQIPRSKFDRSHGVKTSFNAGYLVPVLCDEVLPGDTFSLNMSVFARLATPLYPFMDNMYLESFFFFVPNRLLWTHWEKFNGAQDNPGDSVSFTIPTVSVTAGFAAGSLFDYFGVPTVGAGGTFPPSVNHVTVNALHSRAYNLIWNTWFRDENLQNSVTVDTGDGPDNAANYVLLQRGKRHDYFTSCLPWPQKGTAVQIPLGGSASVWGDGNTVGLTVTGSNTFGLATSAGATLTGQASLYNTAIGSTFSSADITISKSIGVVEVGQGHSGLYADLSGATAATINQLRQAFQTQRMYERDARGGTRYTEIVRSHFGVISPDARLQRPELLGTGRTSVNLHPVPQTSASGLTGGSTKQGDLTAFGTAAGGLHGFSKSFTEHGVILGLVSVRADMSYQQGLNKMWSRQTRLDYYWPALAHIGEQAVLNGEIYYQDNTGGGATANAAVFGYQERFAEMRYKPSIITGQFKSNYTTPLDAWHLAQYFGALPTLGSSFIVESPPMSRVKAVTSAPDFLLDCMMTMKCARPMPLYGVPGNIDRF